MVLVGLGKGSALEDEAHVGQDFIGIQEDNALLADYEGSCRRAQHMLVNAMMTRDLAVSQFRDLK